MLAPTFTPDGDGYQIEGIPKSLTGPYQLLIRRAGRQWRVYSVEVIPSTRLFGQLHERRRAIRHADGAFVSAGLPAAALSNFVYALEHDDLLPIGG